MLVGLESEAKDWDAARATLKDALKIRPDDPEMLRLLVGIDLAASGEPAAFATIARLQADPVTREAARTLVADLNVYTKHYLQAAEAYLAMAKATPSTALVMSAANAYMAGNQPALARGVLNDWLAAHPNDIDTLRALATLEIGSRHLEAAVPLLEKALGQLPSDPVALNNLAWAYQELGDKRALAMGRRAFLLQPSPQSADTLGWILLKQGDARDAMPLLVQAANSLKADPSVQFHLAAALKETGKRDEAIASLAKLVDLIPAFDEQPDARRMLQELQAAQ
jgi:predicted Zn-dependent protease